MTKTEAEESVAEQAEEETEYRYEIDPKLQALLDRGYAAREAQWEMNRRIGEVVEELKKEYPNQSKSLRSALDGHRQSLLAEEEKKKRRAYQAQPSESESNGEGKEGEVSGVVPPVQGALSEGGGSQEEVRGGVGEGQKNSGEDSNDTIE